MLREKVWGDGWKFRRTPTAKKTSWERSAFYTRYQSALCLMHLVSSFIAMLSTILSSVFVLHRSPTESKKPGSRISMFRACFCMVYWALCCFIAHVLLNVQHVVLYSWNVVLIVYYYSSSFCIRRPFFFRILAKPGTAPLLYVTTTFKLEGRRLHMHATKSIRICRTRNYAYPIPNRKLYTVYV